MLEICDIQNVNVPDIADLHILPSRFFCFNFSNSQSHVTAQKITHKYRDLHPRKNACKVANYVS